VLVAQKRSLKGEINVPGDRSISHRAVLFGSLAKGTTEINGFSMQEDCLSTIDCFRKMSVGIEILPNNRIKVHGNGLYGLKAPTSTLNAGRSGTTIRLLLGVLSGQPFSSTITRNEMSIKKPVGNVVQPLRLMGANITGKDDGNYCPLTISPSYLKGITYTLSPYETYVKSSILIAGLYAEGETTVIETEKSRDHSELMLNYFGADIKVDGSKVTSHPVNNLYSQKIEVPGDISMAAYFITAGLIVPNSDIVIKNVGVNPTRAGILDVYKSMGANIEILNERTANNEKIADIRVTSSSLRATVIESKDIPRLIDEIPIITVAAALADGTTVIKGLEVFKIKQSNKINILVTQLSKMGASIEETEDSLIIEGGKPLRGTIVDCNNDFSIAMAMAIAGLAASGETMIRKSQILEVAYPNFGSILRKL